MKFTRLELELLFECVYQSAVNDSLDDFKHQHNLDDKQLDDLTIRLRKMIDAELKRNDKHG